MRTDAAEICRRGSGGLRRKIPVNSIWNKAAGILGERLQKSGEG